MLDSTNITTAQRKSMTQSLLNWTRFSCKKNTIFEQARFNRRCQGEDETAEQFITSLFALPDNCNYGDLRDEFIRDRLVVGIKDAALSEHLQIDADLTLDRTMKAVRQREAIQEQQTVLNKAEASTDTPDKLDSVGTKMKFKHPPRKSTSKAEFKSCSRCGKAYHNRDKCPAKDVACHKCQKKGHFSSQCFSKKPAAQHSVDISSLNATHSSDETIIGASLSEPHIYVVSVNFVCWSVCLSLCLSVRMFITR